MTVPDTTDVLTVQKVTKPFMSWKAGKFKLDCHFDYPKIANHHDFEYGKLIIIRPLILINPQSKSKLIPP